MPKLKQIASVTSGGWKVDVDKFIEPPADDYFRVTLQAPPETYTSEAIRGEDFQEKLKDILANSVNPPPNVETQRNLFDKATSEMGQSILDH